LNRRNWRHDSFRRDPSCDPSLRIASTRARHAPLFRSKTYVRVVGSWSATALAMPRVVTEPMSDSPSITSTRCTAAMPPESNPFGEGKDLAPTGQRDARKSSQRPTIVGSSRYSSRPRLPSESLKKSPHPFPPNDPRCSVQRWRADGVWPP
jgi:hypothetical protein